MINLPTQQLIASLEERFDLQQIPRIVGMMEILEGHRAPELAPMQKLALPLFVPGISNHPWSAERYPWLETLERGYETILAELQTLIAGGHRFEAYGPAYDRTDETIPAETQPALSGWNAFYFYRAGRRQDHACSLCPQTAELLSHIPIGQEALFSVLEPGGTIPEHTDGLNFFLTCHLGLQIPPGCSIQVGSETRSWAPGQTLLFNTSFLHTAHNSSNERRVVLLVDVWHPELDSAEVEAIAFLRPMLERAFGLTPEAEPSKTNDDEPV